MPDRPRVAVTLTQCWHRVPGGTATSILRLLEELVDGGPTGPAVDLVGLGARGDLRRPGSWRAGSLPPRPFVPPIPTVPASLPLPLLYDAWTRFGRPLVETSTGPVDLVHVTVPIRVPTAAAPVVATVHDVLPFTRPELLTRRGARLARSGLEWIRANAVRCMVPSAAVAEACVAHGFPEDSLRVVPWGATVRVPDAAEVRAVLERHRVRPPYVLFVGTLEPRKNLDGLLRAVARLDRSDVTLVVAGPAGWGDDGLGVGSPVVPSPVARLGFVDEGDLPALRRAAAACAVPSLEEGFGLPVLEAMAAGGAVVTSSGTATAEVAGDGALVVDPHDVDALAGALRTLLDDGAGADDLRDRAVRRAGELTWRRCADATVAVYEEVLG